ncbi:Helicase C-terminal [Penicillium taxi]|uniref:Helicase C-terminal n=1 Tax=Penicillium taxi TaxID=168475 RepID=UPI0025450431|nr:Helicase C-terminal [Penicillium taxi]KAJ5893321.1 Helicase C-terminal [Penicillium taxi]
MAGAKRPANADLISETSKESKPGLGPHTVIRLGPNRNANGSANGIQESISVESARASLATANRFTASRILAQGATPPEEEQPKTVIAPVSSQNPLLSLANPKYGLPDALTANFTSLGVCTIYPWQASCLLARGLLSGERHLVYTAPTGGGKSLVADVLLLKRVIENPTRKAILVLPYVALVQEKLKWLRRIVQGVEKVIPDDEDDHSFPHKRWKKLSKGIQVTGFFGGNRTNVTWADTDIAFCTIEKANSLINTAIEECSIGDLGVVVIDELHMLDDEHRGYLLELMVTKLLLLQQDIQIVGMSATLSNTEMLAKWMDAKFYISTFRPVPIDEYLVYEDAFYPAATSRQLFQTASKLAASTPIHESIPPHRIVEASAFKELSNPATNSMVALAVETAAVGYGALVFCGSRQACQTNAAIISEAMPYLPPGESDELSKRLDLLAELRSLVCGLDPVLQTTIIKGVGFHHAGMTTEERELIAAAYDQGVLRVLVATCSLAAGVNLPARRVIINGARMGRELVGPAMLRQTCGRAGRKGKDDAGETYLICVKANMEAVCDLIDADMPSIESCLAPEKRGLKRALLEAIATGLQCHGFAAGIVKFCQRMNWGMLAAVLDHMRDKLEAGARADLLEMAQVTFVKSWTARLLRENGYRNLRALAEADPKDLVPVLMIANPRKTQKSQLYPTEAERYEAMLLLKAETIVSSASMIWEREMRVEVEE